MSVNQHGCQRNVNSEKSESSSHENGYMTSVAFQTGALSNRRELEVTYYHKSWRFYAQSIPDYRLVIASREGVWVSISYREVIWTTPRIKVMSDKVQ